jgi:hypothetical protein
MTTDEHTAALVYDLVEPLLRDNTVLRDDLQRAILQHLIRSGHRDTAASLLSVSDANANGVLDMLINTEVTLEQVRSQLC